MMFSFQFLGSFHDACEGDLHTAKSFSMEVLICMWWPEMHCHLEVYCSYILISLNLIQWFKIGVVLHFTDQVVTEMTPFLFPYKSRKTKSTKNVSYKNQTLNVTNVTKCKIINTDIGKLSLNNSRGTNHMGQTLGKCYCNCIINIAFGVNSIFSLLLKSSQAYIF